MENIKLDSHLSSSLEKLGSKTWVLCHGCHTTCALYIALCMRINIFLSIHCLYIIFKKENVWGFLYAALQLRHREMQIRKANRNVLFFHRFKDRSKVNNNIFVIGRKTTDRRQAGVNKGVLRISTPFDLIYLNSHHEAKEWNVLLCQDWDLWLQRSSGLQLDSPGACGEVVEPRRRQQHEFMTCREDRRGGSILQPKLPTSHGLAWLHIIWTKRLYQRGDVGLWEGKSSVWEVGNQRRMFCRHDSFCVDVHMAFYSEKLLFLYMHKQHLPGLDSTHWTAAFTPRQPQGLEQGSRATTRRVPWGWHRLPRIEDAV